MQVDSAEPPGKPTIAYTAFKLRDKKIRTMKAQRKGNKERTVREILKTTMGKACCSSTIYILYM